MGLKLNCVLILLINFNFFASGQSDSLITSIDTILFKSFKIEQKSNKTAYSTSKVSVNQTLAQNINLQEHISSIPGLFSLNANNFAQDLRISLRGFGSRSPFGIRGIKIIVDGIPETTPDGQGQIDNLNLNLLNDIEVIKGPASVFYGNASGGIININTTEGLKNEWQGEITSGSFGLNKYNLSFSKKIKQTQIIINANHIQSNGYRDHSEFESTAFQVKLNHRFSPRLHLKINSSYTNSPRANDPGGINFDTVEENRRSARDQNVLFESGETINQFKLGTSLEYKLKNNQSINSFAYVSTRNFDGKLPFEFGGAIDLNRIYWGLGTSYTIKKIFRNSINTLQFGYDFGFQTDKRSRFRNTEGVIGDLTLEQDESFNNISFSILDNYDIGRFSFSAGIRFDFNHISVNDNYLADGDQTDNINLNAFNPSIGLNYQLIKKVNLFINYRTSFETPVLSELSANPSGLGGFNKTLKPQKARNIEIGFRIKQFDRLQIDLTFYNISTDDELVSFERPMDDRTFFENAGKTKRNGIEITANYQLSKVISIMGYFTSNHLRFDEFISNGINLEGKKLPGVPSNYGGIVISGKLKNKIGFSIDNKYRGSIFVNNDNSLEENSVFIFNLKLNSELMISKLKFVPFLAINNLTNAFYSDNIRINAFGSRFFEPAPERNFVFGIKFMI